MIPKVYLLKKLNPQDSIWKHYPEDDFIRWVGDEEEEARKNAARGSLPRNKAISMSPWLNKEQTSCELEYNSEQDGVAGGITFFFIGDDSNTYPRTFRVLYWEV